MKVGDLVSLKMKKTQPAQEPQRAVVTDFYIDQDGFEKVEVAWMIPGGGLIRDFYPELFEVISESR